MLIIGITGTLGAGKGTVAEYLVTHYGCAHYSARAFLVEEIARRGLAINRANMLVIANEFRHTRSSDYIIRSLFELAAAAGGPAVLESVRSAGEVNFIHEHGGKILAVDAPPELRYQRIRQRNGADTDQVSFEQFLAAEQAETSSTRLQDSNLLTCIRLADAVLQNNLGLSQLYGQVDKLWLSWQIALVSRDQGAKLEAGLV